MINGIHKTQNQLLEEINQFVFTWSEPNPYEKEITEIARALATAIILDDKKELEVTAAYGGTLYNIRVYKNETTLNYEVSDWGLADHER